MTDSVTRAPDPPLVDPETGETPPLSPHDRALIVEIAEWVEENRPEPLRFVDMLSVRILPPEPDDAA